MTTLARQGYDLIIGVGYAQGDAIATAAKAYPDTKFAIVDVDQSDAEGQARERPRAAVPRGAGGLPRRLPRRARGEACGWRRGSAPWVASRSRPSTASSRATRQVPTAAVPGIAVKWGYSQDWDDQAKCKELALSQIDAGSKVGLPGGRRLRPRRVARRQAAADVGHRCRRRPVVPRPARADERPQGRRQRRVPDGQGGSGRDLHRRRTRPSASTRTASASAPSARTPTRRTSRRRRRSSKQIADGAITNIPTTVGLAVDPRGRPRSAPRAHLAQAVRTEWTGGRCAATGAQVAPASSEPNTSPDVAPK